MICFDLQQLAFADNLLGKYEAEFHESIGAVITVGLDGTTGAMTAAFITDIGGQGEGQPINNCLRLKWHVTPAVLPSDTPTFIALPEVKLKDRSWVSANVVTDWQIRDKFCVSQP